MPVSGCRDFLLAFLLPRTLAVRVRSAGRLNVANQRIGYFRFQLWTFLLVLFEVILSLFLFPQHYRLFHMCDQGAVHHDGNGCQK
ncbi:hypothetical protein L210DRAFT_3557329 [Boletus edulis BED1]|uniref:Uncharacterized protein n=1 Tax=Boletus edulis BED1 TaxID=1328754 RepID=A0AAD4G9T2_BOLED|nr:hypothetical protein L210DRAFT_3557329 [Boletus edulis BED1]